MLWTAAEVYSSYSLEERDSPGLMRSKIDDMRNSPAAF